jgi:hypothetical protein
LCDQGFETNKLNLALGENTKEKDDKKMVSGSTMVEHLTTHCVIKGSNQASCHLSFGEIKRE